MSIYKLFLFTRHNVNSGICEPWALLAFFPLVCIHSRYGGWCIQGHCVKTEGCGVHHSCRLVCALSYGVVFSVDWLHGLAVFHGRQGGFML